MTIDNKHEIGSTVWTFSQDINTKVYSIEEYVINSINITESGYSYHCFLVNEDPNLKRFCLFSEDPLFGDRELCLSYIAYLNDPTLPNPLEVLEEARNNVSDDAENNSGDTESNEVTEQ